jgi:hypothetical protein
MLLGIKDVSTNSSCAVFNKHNPFELSLFDSRMNVAPMHPVVRIHESMHELLDMLKDGPVDPVDPVDPVVPINNSVDDPYVYPTIPLKSDCVLLDEGLYVVKYFK